MKYILLCGFLLVIFYAGTIEATSPLLLLDETFEGINSSDSPKQYKIEKLFEYIKEKQTIQATIENRIIARIIPKMQVEFLLTYFVVNTQPPDFSSKGISDTLIDLKVTIFDSPPFNAIIKAGIQFPTGSIGKIPFTGTGSYDFFYECAGNHFSDEWYAAARYGGLITTTRHGFKAGNEFLYELNAGKHIKFQSAIRTSLFFILQLSLFDTLPNKFKKITDPNTGDFVAFLGPLVSFHRKNILLQALYQVPIGQYLYGNQQNYDFRAALDFQFTF